MKHVPMESPVGDFRAVEDGVYYPRGRTTDHGVLGFLKRERKTSLSPLWQPHHRRHHRGWGSLFSRLQLFYRTRHMVNIGLCFGKGRPCACFLYRSFPLLVDVTIVERTRLPEVGVPAIRCSRAAQIPPPSVAKFLLFSGINDRRIKERI